MDMNMNMALEPTLTVLPARDGCARPRVRTAIPYAELMDRLLGVALGV